MLPRHRRSSRTGTSASYGAGSRSMGAMVGKIAGVLIALAILALLGEDEKGVDEKIIAVPVDKLHPFYKRVASYRDLPRAFLSAL